MSRELLIEKMAHEIWDAVGNIEPVRAEYIARRVLSILSDPANITDEALISFNASVEQSLPYVRMKYDTDTLRRAIAAAFSERAP